MLEDLRGDYELIKIQIAESEDQEAQHTITRGIKNTMNEAKEKVNVAKIE